MIRNPFVKNLVCGLVSLTTSCVLAALEPAMHDAVGDGKTTLPDGRPVIAFDANAPNGASASWKLESPMRAGWHTVEFGFGSENQTRKLVQFECLDAKGEAILSVNLYHAPSRSGTGDTCVMGVYLTKEAKTVRWRKNQQRAMKSAPLVRLRIHQDRPSSAFMEAVALQQSGDSFLFPTDLGGGHLRAVSSKPVALRWQQAGGRSFETPSGNETTAWLDGDLTGLRCPVGDPGISHLERRFESTSPVDPSGLDRPLIPLLSGGRSRHVIEVRGTDLDPAKVGPADFPGGAKMAAVLSWDDGIPQDQRAAELIHRHGWRASFFFNHHSPMVGRWKELEDLGMEVGSHSWSHPFYPLQSPQRCRDESVMMRRFLESKVKHPVISFAYPFNYGAAFDADGDYVLRAQRDAGYLSCRSTMNGPLALDGLGDPLAMRTNGHFLMGREKIDAAWKQAADTKHGVFYIWGHTYEIVKDEDWKSFEDLLRTHGRRPEAWYASQGDLMVWKILREQTHVTAEGDAGRLKIMIDAPAIHPWWAARVPLAIQVSGNGIHAQCDGATLPVTGGDVQVQL
jgi:peptidoglycan/xylan/chitin deacetylase (PgdA/CDA1 family)